MDYKVYIQKRFNHPIEKVWECITQKEHVAKWFMNVKAFDLRPGGKWHLSKESSGGWDGNLIGEIVELDPPRKLVHTFNSNQLNYPMQVTWLLKEDGEGTILTLTHRDFDKISDSAKQAVSIDGGWSACMLELTNYINDL